MGNDNAALDPPIRNIVVGESQHQQQGVVVDTTFHRAVHKIRLSALSQNYSEVESAANRQMCNVIVVVKADGYGHGAIPSAIFLADKIGADAFAVATLEVSVLLFSFGIQFCFVLGFYQSDVWWDDLCLSHFLLFPFCMPDDIFLRLQEGIALRKALQETAAATPGSSESLDHYFNINQTLNSNGSSTNDHHRRQSSGSSKAAEVDSFMSLANTAFSDVYGGNDMDKIKKRRSSRRAAHTRILVLGPPVGFPRCFDDYYHYNIEAMISGPEVAMALYEWVSNTDERKRLQVERAANELKEKILLEPSNQKAAALKPATNGIVSNGGNNNTNETSTAEGRGDNNSLASSSGRSSVKSSVSVTPIQQQIPSATLTNVTGSDLAKEVREILKNQKLAAETQKQQQQEHQQKLNQQRQINGGQTPASANSSTVTPVDSIHDLTANTAAMTTSTAATSLLSAFAAGPDTRSNETSVKVFAGLEEIARNSRNRQKVMANEVFHDHGEEDGDDDSERNILPDDRSNALQKQNHDRNGDDVLASPTKPTTSRRIPTNTNRQALPMTIQSKKRLRWHALVDSGMGRLGFKTNPVSKDDQGKRRDTVEILKELVDLEVTLDCPVEFYGMCTHMAEANSTSNFTDSQMNKFKSVLKRVRSAGISVPTISTDNSSALLTTNLTHFTTNATELLTQTDADSRGFVRTGGAIYGQRPSFSQLRAVSTLMASVRHVATLKEGESVGYDRAYVAPMNVRIATLTIGFADGYPRDLGNGLGRVSIRGHLFPVAGNVCMDMLMVELGPAEDKHGIGAQIVVGDTAILWGPDDGEEGEGHVRLQDVAAILKTTQSALTCGLNKERVLRQYA